MSKILVLGRFTEANKGERRFDRVDCLDHTASIPLTVIADGDDMVHLG